MACIENGGTSRKRTIPPSKISGKYGVIIFDTMNKFFEKISCKFLPITRAFDTYVHYT